MVLPVGCNWKLAKGGLGECVVESEPGERGASSAELGASVLLLAGAGSKVCIRGFGGISARLALDPRFPFVFRIHRFRSLSRIVGGGTKVLLI